MQIALSSLSKERALRLVREGLIEDKLRHDLTGVE
jgi:hypothetical protein